MTSEERLEQFFDKNSYSFNLDKFSHCLFYWQNIFVRLSDTINLQVSNLQTKIKEEDELVEKRTIEILSEWEKAKPVEGAQRPTEALATLAQFEAKINKLAEVIMNLND